MWLEPAASGLALEPPSPTATSSHNSPYVAQLPKIFGVAEFSMST